MGLYSCRHSFQFQRLLYRMRLLYHIFLPQLHLYCMRPHSALVFHVGIISYDPIPYGSGIADRVAAIGDNMCSGIYMDGAPQQVCLSALNAPTRRAATYTSTHSPVCLNITNRVPDFCASGAKAAAASAALQKCIGTNTSVCTASRN